MKYYLPDFDESIEDSRGLYGFGIGDTREFAAAVAEYIFGCEEYFDSKCPMKIAIVLDSGLVAMFEVDMERNPHFTATEIKS